MATSKEGYAWNQSIDVVWLESISTTIFFGMYFPFIEHDSFLAFSAGRVHDFQTLADFVGSFLGHRLVGGGFCSSGSGHVLLHITHFTYAE